MFNNRLATYLSISLIHVIFLILQSYHSTAFLPNHKLHQRWNAPTKYEQFSQTKESTTTDAPSFPNNQLTHAMIRVPSVNATLSYWVNERGATLKSFRESPNGASATAFVGFGGFSLEITSLPSAEEFIRGNAIRYFGLSMLLDFDLRSAAAGDATGRRRAAVEEDVNGWTVKSVAAAPGDSFSRICLRVAKSGSDGKDVLSEITTFYESIGMEVVAGDEQCVCLRFKSAETDSDGVSVNLVFERDSDTDGQLEIGNGFDHLAIMTDNVSGVFEMFNGADMEDRIFMAPTTMFGSRIVGVTDPNGYKVYLYEPMEK